MIDSKDISVIVQGAVDKKLTPKCLKSIRKYLPDAQIILSTWEDSDVERLDYDELVLNKDPGEMQYYFSILNMEHSAVNNFNRQLVSTQNGLKKVTRQYTLKLRSDLMLKNAKFLQLWEEFPVRNPNFIFFAHKVLCSSIYSREYSCTKIGNGFPTPFHPSDFWFFGLTEDIKDYFADCPQETKEEGGNWKFKYPNRLPYSSMLWRFAPEQFFCVNWVKKYYPNLKFYDWSDWNSENIELSNNILYNNFIFLDYKQSGIFSKKHIYAFEKPNQIQGLISFHHFQEQYQKYCDSSYTVKASKKNYRSKLYKHYEKFIRPFCSFKSWISEMFSVLYYAILVLLFQRGKK